MRQASAAVLLMLFASVASAQSTNKAGQTAWFLTLAAALVLAAGR